MPRKPRELEIGGIYHIVNRGVEKRLIFLKKQDYSRFILALEFFNDRHSLDLWNLIEGFNPTIFEKRVAVRRKKAKDPLIELLAFALMPNHYHLIVREITPHGISSFMQKLGGYTSYFNKQYKRVGPLFQSRYKPVSIKDDIQLHAAFAYVHTNPVELVEPGWKKFKVENKKRSLEFLETYQWSSCRDYMNKPTFPSVTQRGFFLKFLGNEQKAQRAIENWVEWRARKSELDLEIFE